MKNATLQIKRSPCKSFGSFYWRSKGWDKRKYLNYWKWNQDREKIITRWQFIALLMGILILLGIAGTGTFPE